MSDSSSSTASDATFPYETNGRQQQQQQRRGCWPGGISMELERDDTPTIPSKHAAVDLDQFRNVVVGQGYQAKHVVRQKGFATNTTTSSSSIRSKSIGVPTQPARIDASTASTVYQTGESSYDNDSTIVVDRLDKERVEERTKKRSIVGNTSTTPPPTTGKNNRTSKKHKKSKHHKHSSHSSTSTSKEKKGSEHSSTRLAEQSSTRLAIYLNCPGLRQFRKELENIVS